MIDTDTTRRQFVQRLAGGMLGVSIADQRIAAPTRNATADHVIYLFMDGGMSHLDTFDLRPDQREIQGPLKAIKTNIPGIHVSEHLPHLAKQMHRIAQVRSMRHTQGNHAPGQYHMRTGYPIGSGVVAHPAIGAWVTKQARRLSESMPPYIRVGDLGGHPSNGCPSTVMWP